MPKDDGSYGDYSFRGNGFRTRCNGVIDKIRETSDADVVNGQQMLEDMGLLVAVGKGMMTPRARQRDGVQRGRPLGGGTHGDTFFAEMGCVWGL